MTPFKKPFYSALVFFSTLVVLSFVYAATTYYMDLPTASSGSTLTSANWNSLVNYANKAVKQETEVLTVTGGNVGIGTPTPSERLDVTGNGKFSGTVTAAEPTSSSNLATKNYVDTKVAAAGTPTILYSSADQNGVTTAIITAITNKISLGYILKATCSQ